MVLFFGGFAGLVRKVVYCFSPEPADRSSWLRQLAVTGAWLSLGSCFLRSSWPMAADDLELHLSKSPHQPLALFALLRH
jgi:hypothetical protein